MPDAESEQYVRGVNPSARVRSVDLDNPFLASLDGLCELLLVRHGEQFFFDGMTMGDAYDPPLTDLGRRQAEAVGDRLASTELDAVFCSTMQRAIATASAIAAHHGLQTRHEHEIREVNPWESFPADKALLDVYTKAELVEIFSRAHRERRYDAYPHCEDPASFRHRVISAIDAIAAAHVGQRVVVTCHGGVIGAYLAHCFESRVDTVMAIHHTSITTIRVSGERRVVLTANDFHHLAGVQTQRNPLNAH